MLALTSEAAIVVAFGSAVALVGLILFVVRGAADAGANVEAKFVKFSAPASVVLIALGAGMVLLGTGFVTLGPSGDDGERAAQSPTTVEGVPPTTTTLAPASTTTTALHSAPAPPLDDELAFTGFGLTATAGVGFVVLGIGVGLDGRSRRERAR